MELCDALGAEAAAPAVLLPLLHADGCLAQLEGALSGSPGGQPNVFFARPCGAGAVANVSQREILAAKCEAERSGSPRRSDPGNRAARRALVEIAAVLRALLGALSAPTVLRFYVELPPAPLPSLLAVLVRAARAYVVVAPLLRASKRMRFLTPYASAK